MNWEDVLVAAFANRLRIGVIKILLNEGSKNISRMARELGVSYSVMERNLEEMKRAGIVEEVRVGRVRIFRLSKNRRVYALLGCLRPDELEDIR